MNIRTMRVLFFSIFSISFFSCTQSATIQSLSEEQEKRIFVTARTLVTTTYTALIQSMQTLENNLEYWITQSKNPKSYALIRGPLSLFSAKNTSELIQENITALKRTEKIHAHALGKLAIIRQTKDIALIEYCTKSLEIIASLIPISYNKNTYTHKNLDKLEKDITDTLFKMQNYKQCFNAAIAPHTKPSHVVRNWWKYLLGTAAVATVSYLGYKHKEELSSGYNKALETLKIQGQKKVFEPTREIIHTISSKMQEDIAEKNRILDIREKAVENEATLYFSKNGTPKEKVSEYVQKFMNGDNSEIIRDKGEQMRNLGTNITNDAYSSAANWFKEFFVKPEEAKSNFILPSTIDLYSLAFELKTIQGEREINALKESQKINILLFSLAPALLVTYGVYKISTTAFNSLFFKKKVLIPLQERTLLIRRMLNHFDNGTTTELPYEMHGHLTYWIEKLKQYSAQLPKEEQENFTLDLQELASLDINVTQKHEVIKRMYDIYAFLRPNKN